MRDFEIKNEIKEKIYNELESFVEREQIENDVFEAFVGKNVNESYNEVWGDVRDELIDELNDRLFEAIEVIGYAKGLEIASALRYWNWEDNDLGLEVTNAETLGFVASYQYVTDEGLVYDIVDEYLLNEFEVELNA